MENYRDLLCVSCRSCGAPAGFDIINQTYRCAYCGEVTGIRQAKEEQLHWKTLARDEILRTAGQQGVAHCSCPKCGAELMFPEGEVSETCEFCNNKLVRSELASPENIPEMIIPFFITADEAKERLLQWGREHEKSPEGRSVVTNIGKMQAYYLPYRLVKGPVEGTVSRDGTERRYHCQGYLEGIAVNTSKQLDNLVLNDVEPFDWSEAKQFDYGYIAGHKVKLNDLSDLEIENRIKTETVQDFLPVIQKTLQTTGVDVELRSGELTTLSVLLPVYFIKCGNLTAVMNGQTGRIAVTQKRKKTSFPWAIEPTIYTLLATFLFALWARFSPESIFYGLCFFGCIFFATMSDGRGPLTKRITLRSAAAKTARTNGELVISEEKDILKNPYDNTPVFFENDENGARVPVQIRFYSVPRVLSMMLNSMLTIFLPLIPAAVIRLIMVLVQGGAFADRFHPEYGGAWYTLAALIVLIYFVRGARNDVYNHPLLYRKLPDGRQQLMGRYADRKVTVFSIFGIGKTMPDGSRMTIFKLIRSMGKEGVLFVILFVGLLVGSTLAIVF